MLMAIDLLMAKKLIKMYTEINKKLIQHAAYINRQYENNRITKLEYDMFYRFIKDIDLFLQLSKLYVSDIEMANMGLHFKYRRCEDEQEYLIMQLKNLGEKYRNLLNYFSNLLSIYNNILNKYHKKLDKNFIIILKQTIKDYKEKKFFTKC